MALKLSIMETPKAPVLPKPQPPANKPSSTSNEAKPSAPKRKRSSSDIPKQSTANSSGDESDGGAEKISKRPATQKSKDADANDKESSEGGATKKRSSSIGVDGVKSENAEKSTKPAKSNKSRPPTKSKVPKAPPSKQNDTADEADDEADAVNIDLDDAASGGEPKPKAPSTSSSSSKNHRSKENDEEGEQDGLATPKEPTTSNSKKRKSKPSMEDDERRDSELDKDGNAMTPRYQSHRAAAMVAKTKLNSRGPKPPADDLAFGHVSSAGMGSSSKAKTAAEQAALQWIACDRCGKWRTLPSHVDMDALPEQWYCEMNLWDNFYNDCAVDEEVVEDPVDDGSNADDADGELGADDAQGSYREGPGSRNMSANVAVEKVNWVQCNKCTKWRKAPGAVDVDSLPDVWQCSMNTWAPAFARCTAREELAEEPEQSGMMQNSALMRGRRPGNNMSNAAVGAQPLPVKKVIQWVQCERRNCKKWRKLPGHVDMSLLPEKWYCEMNEWDLDRASCECPEDPDSEGEQNVAADSRTQLMAPNTKNVSSLSYRRIIFGTDGRVRPNYSEKNKNGFGLFSYTETTRHVEDNNDEEFVPPEPTRRISYWWSSAYDPSGAKFLTTPAQHPSSAGYSSAIKREISRESAVADTVEPETEVQPAEVVNLPRDKPVHHLLRASRKLGGIDVPMQTVFPLKRLKHHTHDEKRTMQEHERAECTVIRSILQSSSTLMLSFPALLEAIRASYFHAHEVESCRSRMCPESIKTTLQRLEAQGEVDITFSGSGMLMVQSSLLPPQQPESVTTEPYARGTSRAPLKMRKFAAKNGQQGQGSSKHAVPASTSAVSADSLVV